MSDQTRTDPAALERMWEVDPRRRLASDLRRSLLRSAHLTREWAGMDDGADIGGLVDRLTTLAGDLRRWLRSQS